MSKIRKILVCLLAGALFSAPSACAIGGGTITFDSNGGTYAPEVSYNAGQTVSSLPMPSKMGYRFVGWSSRADFSHMLYAPFQMGTSDFTAYAKYEIDESFFISNILTWDTGESAQLSYSGNACILLNKNTAQTALSQITVTDENGNAVECYSFRVSDEYGRVIADGDGRSNVWMPAQIFSPDAVGQFVLDFSAYANQVVITVS